MKGSHMYYCEVSNDSGQTWRFLMGRTTEDIQRECERAQQSGYNTTRGIKKTTAKDASTRESLAWLRQRIKPGDTVYVIRRTRSSIDLYLSDGENGMTYLSGHAAAAIGCARTRNGAVNVGWGESNFAAVSSLARAIFPEGFACLGDHDSRDRSCPSNDHSNDRHAADGYNPERWHADGGYALREKTP